MRRGHGRGEERGKGRANRGERGEGRAWNEGSCNAVYIELYSGLRVNGEAKGVIGGKQR